MADLMAWYPKEKTQPPKPVGNRKLIRPFVGPVTKDVLTQLERDLGYSVRGPSTIEDNSTNLFTALSGSISALSSKVHHPAAWNDRGDAVRHAEWSAKMAGSAGEMAAKTYGDAHERDDPRNEAAPGEMYMDLINNHNGRILREKFPNMRGNALAEWVADRGLLQITPLEIED